LPQVPQIAVFDTAFYYGLPDAAKLYALPLELLQEYKIQRFGFHGISHEYVAKEVAKKQGKDLSELNLILCHLGGGCSVTAVKGGKAVDTSMGYTPMEGLPMMTRSGDIDPGVIFELIKEFSNQGESDAVAKAKNILNFESGIKGLSGGAGNFLELLSRVEAGDRSAQNAFDFLIYRIAKYVASYLVALDGQLDAVAFTGMIGANSQVTRDKIMERLKFLKDVSCYAVQPDEELAIAGKVKELLD